MTEFVNQSWGLIRSKFYINKHSRVGHSALQYGGYDIHHAIASIDCVVRCSIYFTEGCLISEAATFNLYRIIYRYLWFSLFNITFETGSRASNFVPLTVSFNITTLIPVEWIRYLGLYLEKRLLVHSGSISAYVTNTSDFQFTIQTQLH